MKLRNGSVKNGQWVEGGGELLVSPETERLMKNVDVVLFVRDEGDRVTNGAIFVFSMPPQSFERQQENRASLMYSRHGYAIGEGGLEAPTFKFEGNFGWRLKTAHLPKGLLPIGPKRAVAYDRQTGDFFIHLPAFGLGDDGAESWIESLVEGKVSFIGLKQTLDGRQAYKALSDLCLYYIEENQKRVKTGDTPLEMVLYYPLEELRWVVVPRGMPLLRRRWEEQGKWPYSLSLTGVYDDSRPQAKKPDDPWALPPVTIPRASAGESRGNKFQAGVEQ